MNSLSTPLSTTTWATPPTTTPGSGSPRASKGQGVLLPTRSVPPLTRSPTIRRWWRSTAQGELTHPQGSPRTHTSTPAPTRRGHALLWPGFLPLFDSRDSICTKMHKHTHTHTHSYGRKGVLPCVWAEGTGNKGAVTPQRTNLTLLTRLRLCSWRPCVQCVLFFWVCLNAPLPSSFSTNSH